MKHAQIWAKDQLEIFAITPEYPTHTTVLGLGLRLGLGLGSA